MKITTSIFLVHLISAFFFIKGDACDELLFHRQGEENNYYYVAPGNDINIDGIVSVFLSKFQLIRANKPVSFHWEIEDLSSKQPSKLKMTIPVINKQGVEEITNLDVILKSPVERLSFLGGSGKTENNPIFISGIQSEHEIDEIIDLYLEKNIPEAEFENDECDLMINKVYKIIYSKDKKENYMFFQFCEPKRSILDNYKKKRLVDGENIKWRNVLIGNLIHLSLPMFVISNDEAVSLTDHTFLSNEQKSFLKEKDKQADDQSVRFFLADEFFWDQEDQSFYISCSIMSQEEIERYFPQLSKWKNLDRHEISKRFVDYSNQMKYVDLSYEAGIYESPYVMDVINGIPVVSSYVIMDNNRSEYLFSNIYFLENKKYLLMFARSDILDGKIVWRNIIKEVSNSVKCIVKEN